MNGGGELERRAREYESQGMDPMHAQALARAELLKTLQPPESEAGSGEHLGPRVYRQPLGQDETVIVRL